jgi:hypothetical protein
VTPRDQPRLASPGPQPTSPRQPRLARSEARRHTRQVARLRVATITLLIVALISAPLGYFVIREAAKDPVYAELDRWDLPKWARVSHQDQAYGSRWCIRECRMRERAWRSEREVEPTNQAFLSAIRGKKWSSWKAAGCPAEGIDGIDTCWQRDEYVMDVWITAAECVIEPVRPQISPTAGPSASKGASTTKPAAGGGSSSVGPSVLASPSIEGSLGPGCGTSIVTVKVYNRNAYLRAA